MIGIRLWQVAGWTMLHYLWVGGAIGAAILLVRHRLRSAAAGVRYLVALGSLLLLIAAPAAIAVVLMQDLAPISHEAPLPTYSAADADVFHSQQPHPAIDAAPAAVTTAPDLSQPFGGLNLSATLDMAATYLPWLWVCGAPLSFALTTAGLLGAERLRRQSRLPQDVRISETCRQLAASLKISYRVGVAVCDRIAAPILVGILRPMILLPAVALTGWDPQQLEMVLLHELAHVRRFDNLVNLLQRIIESVLFFQPMVWIVSGWVRREREQCCDELVVARTHQPRAYAEMLVNLSERYFQKAGWDNRSAVPPIHPRVVSAMAERPLVARIRRILKKEEQTMQVSGKMFGAMFASLLILVTMIGGYCSLSSFAEDYPKTPSNEKTLPAASDKSVGSKSNAAATPFKDEPAAHALYNQMIETLRKAQSLSYVSQYQREGTAGYKANWTYRMWLKKPNYFRAETEPNSLGKKSNRPEERNGGILIGDGGTMWVHWPQGRPRFLFDTDPEAYQKTRLSTYMKKPAPPGCDSIWHEMPLLGMGFPVIEPSTFHGYTDCLQGFVDGVRSLGTEKIAAEECDKIEVGVMNHQRSWYFSLSRRDHLPRKLKEIVRVSYDIVTSEEWSSVTLNADIPDAMFRWKPPEDWTQWKLPEDKDLLLKPGTTAPDFELASVDGKRIKLSDYRGHVVWLCFWRAGCPPCREEMPHLQDVYTKYKDKGLVVLAVNATDDRKITLDFFRQKGITFPNILDPGEAAEKVRCSVYGTSAVPLNYLIDREGKIADVWLGYQHGDPRPMAALQKMGGPLGEAIRNDMKKPVEALAYTGQVTDISTGKPLAGVAVTVLRIAGVPGQPRQNWRKLGETKHQTDADGRFRFTLPPEQLAEERLAIAVDVICPGYVPSHTGNRFETIRKKEKNGERLFFEHIQLSPLDPITGTVVTPDGKPAMGVRVHGEHNRMNPAEVAAPDTTTDQQGAFCLNFAKGGSVIFAVLPKDYAPSVHIVNEKRGDVGRIVLEKGTVLTGRVMDDNGKPVEGVWVNAGGHDDLAKTMKAMGGRFPISIPPVRSALTDAKGEFTLAPLPAGQCQVGVASSPYDLLLGHQARRRQPPAVFVPQRLTLSGATQSVELRAVPHVVIEGQCYDSRGKPCYGRPPVLIGHLDSLKPPEEGQSWWRSLTSLWGGGSQKETDPSDPFANGIVSYGGTDAADNTGHFVILAPIGLKDAELRSNSLGSKIRMAKDEPAISQWTRIMLGTLDHDIRGIEIVCYKSTIVIVKPVAEDGSPVRGAEVHLDCGDLRVGLTQSDGRYQSWPLLPDEEFTVSVEADGYEPHSQKLKLPEGAVKELEIRLKKRS